MKKPCFRIASVLAAWLVTWLVTLAVLVFVSCKHADDNNPPLDDNNPPIVGTPVSTTPATAEGNAVVYKNTDKQDSVTFILTSSHPAGTVWKVYTAETGTSTATGVEASFSAPHLELSYNEGEDLESGFYYVTATEPKKLESARLKLEVKDMPLPTETPTASETNADKETADAASAVFTLTSGYSSDAIWKVYGDITGGTALTTVTASFDTTTKQLTIKTTDNSSLTPQIYFVSVTEAPKAESERLGLTVMAYSAPDQSRQPAFAPGGSVFKKTAPTITEATFTLTGTITYGATDEWKVYATPEDTTELTGVTVSVSGATLTLTAVSGGEVAAGKYYVTVKEDKDGIEKASPRAELIVEPYPSGAIIKVTFGDMPTDPVTVTGNTTVVKGTALTVIVDNAGSYTSFEWWLDGVKQPATTSTYNTGTALDGGLHRLTVVAYKDSVPFSKELAFTVTTN